MSEFVEVLKLVSPSALPPSLLFDMFIPNLHFYMMLNIINVARLNPPVTGDHHHIIPRCYFKRNGLAIDNSDRNVVLLTRDDHRKVHILASKCAQKPYIASMNRARAWMSGERPDMKGSNNPFYGKRIAPEHRERMVESLRRKGAWNKGLHGLEYTKHYKDGVKGPKGRRHAWNKGCMGRRWFTNGLDEVIDFECPEGYRPGRK